MAEEISLRPRYLILPSLETISTYKERTLGSRDQLFELHHRLDGLFDWRFTVETMAIIQIDLTDAKKPQALCAALLDVLGITSVGQRIGSRIELNGKLGGKEDLAHRVSAPVKVLRFVALHVLTSLRFPVLLNHLPKSSSLSP